MPKKTKKPRGSNDPALSAFKALKKKTAAR